MSTEQAQGKLATQKYISKSLIMSSAMEARHVTLVDLLYTSSPVLALASPALLNLELVTIFVSTLGAAEKKNTDSDSSTCCQPPNFGWWKKANGNSFRV